MVNKFAISDIHGCLKTFKALLNKVDYKKTDELYLLGDFIDRGPDSKGVIDFVWELEEAGFYVRCLRGNHDQMMVDARRTMDLQQTWLVNGGDTTAENFNASHIRDIPARYFNFFEQLPYYLEVDSYIMVHAGFEFDMPNPFDEFHAMLWEREWYDRIDYRWLGDRKILHGHTPIIKSTMIKSLYNLETTQYLDIDAGCVHKGKEPGYGHLACFLLNEKEIIFQENIDF